MQLPLLHRSLGLAIALAYRTSHRRSTCSPPLRLKNASRVSSRQGAIVAICSNCWRAPHRRTDGGTGALVTAERSAHRRSPLALLQRSFITGSTVRRGGDLVHPPRLDASLGLTGRGALHRHCTLDGRKRTRRLARPRINGLPFLHKPPLYFWLEASALNVFGISPFSARLASVVSAVVMSSCAYMLVRRFESCQRRRLVSRSHGFQPPFLRRRAIRQPRHVGRSADNADDNSGGACHFIGDPAPAPCRIAAYVSAALAVLAKGLIGAVLPGLIFLVWAFAVAPPRLDRESNFTGWSRRVQRDHVTLVSTSWSMNLRASSDTFSATTTSRATSKQASTTSRASGFIPQSFSSGCSLGPSLRSSIGGPH